MMARQVGRSRARHLCEEDLCQTSLTICGGERARGRGGWAGSA